MGEPSPTNRSRLRYIAQGTFAMLADPDVQQVAATYRLGLPRMPATGRSGELLGRGTGSSLEFQEYREYLPGDDIRHLDWAAYGRSDALMVRLYREEISPRTEILLDVSRSMTTGDGAKAQLARQLAAVFALLAGRLGAPPTVTAIGDEAFPLPPGNDGIERVEQLPFAGRATLADLLTEHRVPLKSRSVRIVISDFLFPFDAESMIHRLAADATALWVVQVLHDYEADPAPLGGRKLIDAETGREIDVIVDARLIEQYKERFGRQQSDLTAACRRVHAPQVLLIAERGLHQACRENLCAVGMLQVD